MRRFLYAILGLTAFGSAASGTEPINPTAMALATIWSDFTSELNGADASDNPTAMALATIWNDFTSELNATQPVDSTAMALATVWSEFISERNASDAPADSAAYMAGITEALKATKASDSRLRGIAEGMAMARQLSQMERQTGLKIDREVFASALQQAAQGNTAGFTRTSAEAYLDNMAAAAAREASQRTARESSEFLSAKAKLPGVTMTPSGLLFEVVTEGEGVPPSADDTVDVYYTGTLPDGTVFDSTTEGKPASFTVGRTVKGFAEGLQMMKPGGRYRLYIPAALAYGDQGAGGVIPPGSAIAFDVELLNVKQH